MSEAERSGRGEVAARIFARNMVGERLSLIPHGSADREPMPPLQRRPAARTRTETEPSTGRGAEGGDVPDDRTERVQTKVKPEDLADRVYEMLRREMKLDRERAGWR